MVIFAETDKETVGSVINILIPKSMRVILSILFILIGIVAQAQDRLEPFRERTKEDGLCSVFYQQELWRLLNPNNAEWGVLRNIELMTEASLTYDAATHSLVFTEIDGILFGSVRDATTKRIDKGNFSSYKNRKRVKKNYKAPGTKSISLAIPDRMANKLKALWLAAVSTSAENNLKILAGVSWTYFVDGKKAKGQGEAKDWVRVPRLNTLANNLIKAVKKQDGDMLLRLEQEIDELYRLFINGQ